MENRFKTPPKTRLQEQELQKLGHYAPKKKKVPKKESSKIITLKRMPLINTTPETFTRKDFW